MGAIAIYSSGMVTAVGLDAPASCAAIRVGISGAVETRFLFADEWLQGCPVPLDEPRQEIEKLRRMVVLALEECLAVAPAPLNEYPLLLCLAEKDRPGRLTGLDHELLGAIAADLAGDVHPDSRLYSAGRVGGVQALDQARRLIAAGAPGCVVAGVDTYLLTRTLTAYDAAGRLITAENSNGFIPGEAAAAVLVGPVRRQSEPQLLCLGLGFGREPAPWASEDPLRAEGLTDAIKAAFADGRCDYGDVDFRLTDNNGEAYGFKDGTLAVTRTLRDRKEEFDIWHPVECVGEVGAAMVPLMIGVMQAATAKNYAPGPGALCHVSGEGDERAAWILQQRMGGRT